MMHKSIWLLIGLTSLLSACQQAAEEAIAPRPVWVMTVGEPATPDTARYTGEVKSRYESPVGFRIAGKINERLVNIGDVVRQGQVLARLDASDNRLNAQAAQAEVQAAEAQLNLAQAELNRRQQLLQQQFISRSALDSYETQVRTAQARLQQAQAQAALSQHQTAYTQLLADRTGVVGMIAAEPGQVVAAGQAIAQIYDLQALEVVIAVPETRITALHPGEAATVTLGAQSYAGRIREIAPAANSQTHAFDLRIQVLNADPSMKLGMTADVQFNNRPQTAAPLWVPSTAVTQLDGQTTVWVIDTQQQAHPRRITIGTLTEAGVQVLSGLQPGERIATMGVHTLQAGMQVQAITPDSKVLH